MKYSVKFRQSSLIALRIVSKAVARFYRWNRTRASLSPIHSDFSPETVGRRFTFSLIKSLGIHSPTVLPVSGVSLINGLVELVEFPAIRLASLAIRICLSIFTEVAPVADSELLDRFYY